MAYEALRRRRAIIAAKVEVTEGSKETVAAGDANIVVYEPKITRNIETFKRKPARRTLSSLPAVTGVQAGGLSFMTEFKGSGSLTTVPSWDVVLRMCGHQRHAVKTIAIGAVTSGPFYCGERITAPSGAEGMIVTDVSATPIYYILLNGTDFANTDVITGAVSGASATASGAPAANKGYAWRPLSETKPPAVTLMRYLDGTVEGIYGARGNIKINARVGEPFMAEIEAQGVLDSLADATILEPDFETTVPGAALDCGIALGTDTSLTMTNFSMDRGNTLALRKSLNATKGVLSAYITDSEPKITLDPELPLVASHDFMGKLRAGTLTRFVAKAVGSGTANTIWFGAPRGRYLSVSDEDRDGVAVAGLEMELTTPSLSDGDDEYVIAMV